MAKSESVMSLSFWLLQRKHTKFAIEMECIID